MPQPVFQRTHQRPYLHPLLLRLIAQALNQIFLEGKYADKVIEHTLRNNPKAGSRDRQFIAETTYEVVRYHRFYAEILGRTPRSEHDYWQLIGIHFIVRQADSDFHLPDLYEFKDLDTREILQKADKLAANRAIRESIPDWLDQLGEKELGAAWSKTLSELNRPAQVVLRANTLKTNRFNLRKNLQGEGVEADIVDENIDAVALTERRNVFQTETFKKGHFEVQDFSSQLVAPFLNPQPGMRVVDACAGGGGKTLHLAALMQNKGQLIALDTLAWKLDELKLRARRAGATNIETRVIDNKKVVKRLYETADRLLLDVPCSGLGVLKRNPDSKWKITPEQIDQLRVTQQEILQSYSPIVKPGGMMVYATCSVLPSENEEQIQRFLASEAGKSFTLLNEKRIMPQDNGFDGFFMALLQRNQKEIA